MLFSVTSVLWVWVPEGPNVYRTNISNSFEAPEGRNMRPSPAETLRSSGARDSSTNLFYKHLAALRPGHELLSEPWTQHTREMKSSHDYLPSTRSKLSLAICALGDLSFSRIARASLKSCAASSLLPSSSASLPNWCKELAIPLWSPSFF